MQTYSLSFSPVLDQPRLALALIRSIDRFDRGADSLKVALGGCAVRCYLLPFTYCSSGLGFSAAVRGKRHVQFLRKILFGTRSGRITSRALSLSLEYLHQLLLLSSLLVVAGSTRATIISAKK